jgi:hypothetical protein
MDPRAASLCSTLSGAEQRVLSRFLAGRLPAGQLDGELTRAREAALAAVAAAAAQRGGTERGASPAPALRAA